MYLSYETDIGQKHSVWADTNPQADLLRFVFNDHYTINLGMTDQHWQDMLLSMQDGRLVRFERSYMEFERINDGLIVTVCHRSKKFTTLWKRGTETKVYDYLKWRLE